MKLALNGATIMRSSIASDVDIAAECGYDALELWAAKLDACSASQLDDVAAGLRGRGVAPWCINSIEDITFRDADGRRALIDELRLRLVMARTLGAPSIVVVPGQRDDAPSRAAAIDDAVDVLRHMSDVAGDVALAFEFLGKPGCTVPTLGMAIEIVKRVDRPNVGLVIDTFHFYAGGSDFADLEHVPLEKLFVVHLNGCEDLPRDQLTDAHRLYPGEGAIPIVEILAPLRARGYDGMASVEIFRPEYWAQDPRTVARNAREGALSVLRAAGFVISG